MSGPSRARRIAGVAIVVMASAIGVLAFVSPFVWLAQPNGSAGRGDSPLVLVALITLCVSALVLEAQDQLTSAKHMALLAVLIATNSALRLAETVLPGPGGFTPIFLLIISTGYVFGARTGFLMGALTLLVSAFVTGGVGPWLPYQMFTAGWVGLSAGWLGLTRGANRDAARCDRMDVAAMAAFGVGWGFLYGAVMNLWEWPFQAGDPSQSFRAGITMAQALQRYAAYYAVTSAWWDAFAAVGNAVLIIMFGRATVNVLRRFKRKLRVEVVIEPE